MKVLILGGSGMFGHKLAQIAQKSFDVQVTLRQALRAYEQFEIFEKAGVITGVAVEDFDSVARAVNIARPQVIVNCIGIVKQCAAANDAVAGITINSLFPHRLALLAGNVGARVIHLSTDCVFSGRRGNYSEDDLPDADDLYGRTKLLSELTGRNCLTIRTSMIGRELQHSRSLLEWFTAQKGGRVRGFRRAIFSGVTTLTLAEVIVDIIDRHAELHGVWHVSGPAISKFDLLRLVQKTYALDIEIEPDDSFVCDRSLNASRFEAATGLRPPSWPEMIARLHADSTPYEAIRRANDSPR